MLDIHFIRANVEQVKAAIVNKKLTHKVSVDDLLVFDRQLLDWKWELEEWLQQKNVLDGKVATADSGTKLTLIEHGKELKQKIKLLEEKISIVQVQFDELMLALPNITSPKMPIGKDESENVVLHQWGTVPHFDFVPRDHVALGEMLDLIDCQKSGEISGSRTYYLKNAAVRLQFALVHFVLDTLTNPEIITALVEKVGNPFATAFVPMLPPLMIKPEVLQKMDRLNPIDERYKLADDNLVLIGSAEHTLGSYHMNETWQEKDLPIRYIGYSPAFRREAGSYGKDVRGILRVHHFDKLEMESFVPAQFGEVEQDFFVAIQEYLVQQLQLPYQLIQICTGDTGKPDYNQYDIECWIPSQNRYRETHTSDYMTDFQARRLNIRYKTKEGNNPYVHMNDATAFAIPRTLIAILENYQQEDGTVIVPEVLRKYMGVSFISKRNV